MLQAQNLFKTYDGNRQQVAAVAGVSLSVSTGEFLAICGRSGSGKSTLLALLAGLTAPSGGTVSIDGTDLFALSGDERTCLRRALIGVVLQFDGLLPTLRAIDNVAFPALIADPARFVSRPLRPDRYPQPRLGFILGGRPARFKGGERCLLVAGFY